VKKLLLVSMVLALVLGLGLVYAAQFEFNYGDKDSTTAIGIFNAVGGATVTQWNWNCAEQNALVFQSSGNAASMSAAKAESEGGNDAEIDDTIAGIFGGANSNANAGNSGNAGAISGSLAVTGNISLVNQDLTQVAKSESDADVINKVIAKVVRINRAKVEVKDSYNEED